MREFDLNIEKILESWEIYHAVREIIANALDEQVLSQTEDIQIVKKADGWHIIDFGRGLNYHHLTQNENDEKLNSNQLIGRFGVGLKDALATLYRHGIKVQITSKYGIITLNQTSKIGFDDIITLHAQISESINPDMVGTDFLLNGCEDADIEKAKKLFLKFSNEDILESTAFGDVIDISGGSVSSIYINGVKIAEEPNFLFSYNITSLTNQLKKALNRERTNVGRSAYTDRIKSILTACTGANVIQKLVDDLREMGSGNRHDELSWNDVAMYASQKMAELNNDAVFVTTDDLEDAPSIIDDMKQQGLKPVVVPTKLFEKMDDFNTGADSGEHLRTTTRFLKEEKEKLNFEYVDVSNLTADEKAVFSKTDAILELIGGKPWPVKEIRISETIYSSELFTDTVGLWESSCGRITVKRRQLRSLSEYAGTLLHECAHASSGAADVSRIFERELTSTIGCLAERLLSSAGANVVCRFPDFDFSSLGWTYSEEFEAAGIQSLEDICAKPAQAFELKNALEEHIRSCNLSVEACSELVRALEEYDVHIHLDDDVKPDATKLPRFFRNPEITEDEDGNEQLDFEHRQVYNYASWMLPPLLNNITVTEILHHTDDAQIWVETGKYDIVPSKDYSGEIVCYAQKQVFWHELYPYNLLWAIFHGSSFSIITILPNLTSLLSERIDSVLASLEPYEETIIRLHFQYNYRVEDILPLFITQNGAQIECELAVVNEESPLSWGIKHTVERRLDRALRKLRHPSRSKQLRAFVDQPMEMCKRLELELDIHDPIQTITEHTPFHAELQKQNPSLSFENLRQAYLCGKPIHWAAEDLDEKIGAIFPSDHLSYQLLNDTIRHKRVWRLWQPYWLNHPSVKSEYPEFRDMTVEKAYIGDGYCGDYANKAFANMLLIKTATNEIKLYGLNWLARFCTPDKLRFVQYPAQNSACENLYCTVEQKRSEILSKEESDRVFDNISFIEDHFRKLFDYAPMRILRDTIAGTRRWCAWPVSLLRESVLSEPSNVPIIHAFFSEGCSDYTKELISDEMNRLIVLETSTHEKRLYWWADGVLIPHHLADAVLEEVYSTAFSNSTSVDDAPMRKTVIDFCDCCLNDFSLPQSEKEFFTDYLSKMGVTALGRMTIEEMGLSVRAYNCLKRAGINTLHELMQMTEGDLAKVRNLGCTSKEEIINKMRERGLSLKAE